jgi:hypothetical protein
MVKKSRFWGNFWGETGRNTGKWASNKVFGDTGWATPRRHIIDKAESNSRTNRRKEPSEKTPPAANMHNWSNAQLDRVISMANEISFKTNNIDDICMKLDDLLTGARTANKFIHSDNICNKVFSSKIKSGIMRLRRNHEHELADFYNKEFKNVSRSVIWSKASRWILIIFIIVFILTMNYLLGNFDKY